MNYPGVNSPKKPTFKAAKTGTKGAKEFVAGGVAGLIAAWLVTKIWGTDIDPELLVYYTGILVAPVGGALMIIRNIAREIARRYGFDFLDILPAALLLVAFSGCAFSGFKEITPASVNAEGIVDPGGKMVQRTFVFTPPFATHAGEQRFSYTAKPDGEWTLTNGQEGEAQGGDPTAMITAIGTIYTSAFSARQSGFTTAQADELTRLFGIIGKRLGALEIKTNAPPQE